MTKQEIKDLIAAKIAGQGSAVDVGGALPAILNSIVDNIPEPTPAVSPVLDIFPEDAPPYMNRTRAEMVAYLNISEEDLEKLYNGDYSSVRVHLYGDIRTYTPYKANNVVSFGFIESGETGGVNMGISFINNLWNFFEV